MVVHSVVDVVKLVDVVVMTMTLTLHDYSGYVYWQSSGADDLDLKSDNLDLSSVNTVMKMMIMG